MEVKLKLSDILNINTVLGDLIKDNDNEKIDASFKFKVLGVLKVLEAPVSNFETVRNEKIAKYGKKDDDGRVYIPEEDESAVKKFRKDIDVLLTNEVTLHLDKLKAKDVFDKGLNTQTLVVLYPITQE